MIWEWSCWRRRRELHRGKREFKFLDVAVGMEVTILTNEEAIRQEIFGTSRQKKHSFSVEDNFVT